MEKAKKKANPMFALAAIIVIFIIMGMFNSMHLTSNPALEHLKDSYPIIAADLSQFGSPYNNIEALPCTLFIDKEGKIKAMLIGVVKTQISIDIINSDSSVFAKINPRQLINTQLYGKAAPNFIATDINGNTHELSKLKGKEVMITFWATWCKYCRLEMPELIEMRKKIPLEKVEILSISYENEKTVRQFVEKPYI